MSGRAGAGRALSLAVLAALLPAGGASLAAQEGLSKVEVRARTMASVYDNFFRAADGSPEETILGWSTDGRVTVRIDRSSRIEVFAEAEYVRFEELSNEADFTRVERLGESRGLAAGLRLGRHPEVLRLRVSYQDDRPAFNVGDDVRTANFLRAVGDYSYRIGEDWQVGLDGYTAWVTFDSVPANDGRIHGIGGSVRYRGIGYGLQPELGGRFGWRGADAADQEYRQGHVYARLVSIPANGLWMSASYRYRARGYPDAEPVSRNFQRTDEGGQWRILSTYRASPNVHFNFHYDRLDMDSTREVRTFSSQVVGLGVTVLVGS